MHRMNTLSIEYSFFSFTCGWSKILLLMLHRYLRIANPLTRRVKRQWKAKIKIRNEKWKFVSTKFIRRVERRLIWSVLQRRICCCNNKRRINYSFHVCQCFCSTVTPPSMKSDWVTSYFSRCFLHFVRYFWFCYSLLLDYCGCCYCSCWCYCCRYYCYYNCCCCCCCNKAFLFLMVKQRDGVCCPS